MLIPEPKVARQLKQKAPGGIRYVQPYPTVKNKVKSKSTVITNSGDQNCTRVKVREPSEIHFILLDPTVGS